MDDSDSDDECIQITKADDPSNNHSMVTRIKSGIEIIPTKKELSDASRTRKRSLDPYWSSQTEPVLMLKAEQPIKIQKSLVILQKRPIIETRQFYAKQRKGDCKGDSAVAQFHRKSYKFPLNLEHKKHIQSTFCTDKKYKAFFKCIDCRETVDDVECRFKNFRTFQKIRDSLAPLIYFSSVPETRSISNTPKPPALVIEAIREAAQYISASEILIFKSFAEKFRKSGGNYRQLCDGCDGAIFNAHFCCPVCGFEICPNCYIEFHSNQREFSECFKLGSHNAANFVLAFKRDLEIFERFISNDKINSTDIDKCILVAKKSLDSYLYRNSSLDYQFLKKSDVSNDVFMHLMATKRPFVIGGYQKKLNATLWTKEYFKQWGNNLVQIADCQDKTCFMNPLNFILQRFGWSNEKHSYKVVDWPTDTSLKDLSEELESDFHQAINLESFIKYTGSFNLASYLPTDGIEKPDLGPKLYFTTSGSESAATFCIQMQSTDTVYVLAYDEASDLNDQETLCETPEDSPILVQEPSPELGNIDTFSFQAPELELDCDEFFDYSMAGSEEMTNFEPVEINVFESGQTQFLDIRETSMSVFSDMTDTIIPTGIDPTTFTNTENCDTRGILWHIFHPQDLAIIRSFINERFKVQTDAIFDQQTFLNPAMLQELYSKYQICPITIHQKLGDALFIPAGFAYQTQSLSDCISVAVDFVSPWNIWDSLRIGQEIRHLPQGHDRRPDMLQIKEMVYSAYSLAIN